MLHFHLLSLISRSLILLIKSLLLIHVNDNLILRRHCTLVLPHLLSLENIRIEVQKVIMNVLQLSQFLNITLFVLAKDHFALYNSVESNVFVRLYSSKEQTLRLQQTIQFFVKDFSLGSNGLVLLYAFKTIVFLAQMLNDSHFDLTVKSLKQKLSYDFRDLVSQVSYDDIKVRVDFASHLQYKKIDCVSLLFFNVFAFNKQRIVREQISVFASNKVFQYEFDIVFLQLKFLKKTVFDFVVKNRELPEDGVDDLRSVFLNDVFALFQKIHNRFFEFL